jgi:hypothetical protein
MNGNKMLIGVWNMQDIIKMKKSGGCGQDRFTNVHNIHTCPIGCPNLIIAGVAVMHGMLLNFSGNVVHSPGVQVPVQVIPRG